MVLVGLWDGISCSPLPREVHNRLESIKPHHPLFDRFVGHLGRHLVFANDDETTLFENADRGDILFGDMGEKRTVGDVKQKFREGFRGNTLAPMFPSETVADFAMIFKVEADNVSDNLSVGDDRLVDSLVIGHDLRPLRV
jgi:hypothetical protein